MNLLATAVLLLYMRTLEYLAAQAQDAPDATVASMGDPSPIVHALGAIALLLATLALSVYKPRGLTRRGRRHSAATPRRSLLVGHFGRNVRRERTARGEVRADRAVLASAARRG